MNPRRITLAILLGALALTAALLAAKWRDSQSFFQPAKLLARFPVEDAAVINIDFHSLRQGGFLSQKSALEAEYRSFVEATGFDYRRDLDAVTATFGPSGNYYIARGHFDWDRLHQYARKQGGSCYEDLCRMPGSAPERRISFLPLRKDAIAIAVSTDDLAATKLTTPGTALDAKLPEGPAWMLIPGSALRRASSLPSGLRLMLSALTRANRVILKAGPAGAAIGIDLEAECRSAQDAGVLLSQLKMTTASLVGASKQVKDPLLDVLVAGTFHANDNRVTGSWPVPRTMIESLKEGI